MLSRRLVGALYKMRGQPIPPQVVRTAELHFLDAVGVGLGLIPNRMPLWGACAYLRTVVLRSE